MATKPADTTKAKKTAPRKTTERKASPEGAKPARLARAARRAESAPCRVAKCKRPYRAKGYCKTHYRMWRHNAYGNARYKQCSDTSCAKPMATNRHGYCEDHFQSYYVKGVAAAKAPASAKAKPDKKEAVA